MARPIENGPLDFCPLECPHMDISIEKSVTYANLQPYLITHMLVCSHEEACIMWRNRGNKTFLAGTSASQTIDDPGKKV